MNCSEKIYTTVLDISGLTRVLLNLMPINLTEKVCHFLLGYTEKSKSLLLVQSNYTWCDETISLVRLTKMLLNNTHNSALSDQRKSCPLCSALLCNSYDVVHQSFRPRMALHIRRFPSAGAHYSDLPLDIHSGLDKHFRRPWLSFDLNRLNISSCCIATTVELIWLKSTVSQME